MSLYPIGRTDRQVVIDAAADSGESVAFEANGILRGVLVDAPDLDDTDTYTVAVETDDGFSLVSEASLTENSKSAVMVDGNDMALAVPLSGQHVIKVTASGAQAAERTFTVSLLIERRT